MKILKIILLFVLLFVLVIVSCCCDTKYDDIYMLSVYSKDGKTLVNTYLIYGNSGNNFGKYYSYDGVNGEIKIDIDFHTIIEPYIE